MILPNNDLHLAKDVACTIGEIYERNGEKYIDTRLSANCKSDNINIWAKYKPVIDDFGDNRPSDWWRGSTGKCGIERRYHSDLTEMYTSLNNGEKQFWHEKPHSEFRLLDFAKYDTKAKPPMWDSNGDEVIYNNNTEMVTYNIIRKRNYKPDELTIADVWGDEGYFDSMHLGVAFKKGNTIYWMTGSSMETVGFQPYLYRDTIFAPGMLDMFLFLTPRQKDSFNSSIMGGGMFYPIPYAGIHKVEAIQSSTAASFSLRCEPDLVNGTYTFVVTCDNKTGHRLNIDLTIQAWGTRASDFKNPVYLKVYNLGNIQVVAGEKKVFRYPDQQPVNNPEEYAKIEFKLYGQQQLLATTILVRPKE